MSSLAIHPDDTIIRATRFRATTTSSDELRATVRATGALSARSLPRLLRVLEAHRRAGRRYLRVDLHDCTLADRAVLEPLRRAHVALTDAGGMLVFDNADAAAAALLQGGELFVSTAL